MMTYPILRGKRLSILIVTILFLIWGSYWIYQNKTLGFSVKKITSDFPHNPSLVIEEPQGDDLDRLNSILQQKFRFLASGSQSYAFESEDGLYVLKFFRMKHLIPRISDFFRPERLELQRQNLLSIFQAHKLAYDELREDAGLIYIHLNKTDHLKTRLKVVDFLHRTHVVDLDQTEFIIQEKAELIFTRMKRYLKQKDRVGIKQSVASLLQMVRRQLDRGIVDHDKAVKHNYGFVGDRPIHLDIGRIYKADKPKDYDRIASRIQEWLQENSSD